MNIRSNWHSNFEGGMRAFVLELAALTRDSMHDVVLCVILCLIDHALFDIHIDLL